MHQGVIAQKQVDARRRAVDHDENRICTAGERSGIVRPFFFLSSYNYLLPASAVDRSLMMGAWIGVWVSRSVALDVLVCGSVRFSRTFCLTVGWLHGWQSRLLGGGLESCVRRHHAIDVFESWKVLDVYVL